MIDNITLWHKRARPQPTERDLDVQIGCHIEEFIEMMDALGINWDEHEYLCSAMDILDEFSIKLKSGATTVPSVNREALLDSLADQIVTAVGVGVCAKMDMNAAVTEVNESNWSKFNYKGYPEFDAKFNYKGYPEFDENGKIKKGERYRKPDLKGMF